MSKTTKLTLFLLLVIIDQTTKFWSAKKLPPCGSEFFCQLCNPGLSWGITLNINFILLGSLFGIFVIIYLSRKRNWPLFSILILAGAISNLFDRLIHRCIPDFINFSFFPIFNVADVFISIGFFLLIGILIKKAPI